MMSATSKRAITAQNEPAHLRDMPIKKFVFTDKTDLPEVVERVPQ
jgi:hypothetical protein